MKEIILAIIGIFAAGGALKLYKSHSSNKDKDSNKINNINQQAFSNDKVYQSGRDINVK
ncbi:hypothetical protein [Clostridium cuniculi]|uniref:hypothetical protein n=1 Tax=Clostridium cuniculi TaxID=2548455 RepID=UPI00140F8DE3|nr:hypothetical protein [Clostridium cuniculi]